MSELTEAARQELKGAYADASFWKQIESKEVQEISPWYSKRLKQLQSELFIEAMKVNELFILRANATSSWMFSLIFLKREETLRKEKYRQCGIHFG